MKNLILTLTIVFGCVVFSFSQTSRPKVFVAPMEDGFDTFIAAALLDNTVPVTITSVEADAEYILSGQAVKGQNHWYDTVFGAERDRSQGSIKLLKVSDKSIVWAGAAGDRSIWWGALKSGGQKKVANRLARKLKSDYFNSKYRPTGPTTSSEPVKNESSPTTPSPAKKAEIDQALDATNLSIKSTPTGADVIVDGKLIGRTPAQLTVKDGDHVIAITKSGYPLWQRTVTIISGSKLSIEAALEKP